MNSHPLTWLILSDKQGDNRQVETLVASLRWPVVHKYVHMRPQYVKGKPRHKPSLHHIDMASSDSLEQPWPDLIITVGRRPSMAALWVRKQSGGKSKIVLIGKPTAHMMDFALVVSSAENQMPPLPNYLPVTLPLMRVKSEDVVNQVQAWSERFAALKRPLIAILVGGETNPFKMNKATAQELVATARWVVDELGGTPYVTTSRRTTAEVVDVLRESLPDEAILYQWSAEALDNPYQALMGSADGFVVTADSVSMMVEVIYLQKPLAIFPLPSGVLGRADQARRSLAHWLFNARKVSFGDRVRHGFAMVVYHVDVFKLLCATRDFRAFHAMLVDSGFAVWAGQPFVDPKAELPDDVGTIVSRIEALFADEGGAR
ncbi:MAG: ELM1/GtrOC1 family putative glycosyltransferase [Halioglobus sp.]